MCEVKKNKLNNWDMQNPELLDFAKSTLNAFQRLYHEYNVGHFNWAYGTHYETLIIYFYIFFLTGPEGFNLKDCTEADKANTSICLKVEEKNFTCDKNKIRYIFQCGKNIALIKVFLW